jgi:choloylglycine hydrolase
MVDLEFLGIRPEDSMNLTEQPLSERKFLLSAPSMPFDGMNEYGLTVGMAAVPGNYTEHAPYDPTKPTIGSIGILRQALDHARYVDEAVKLFQQYNIDYRGGPLIHYLLADPSGKAVLVEYYQGELFLLPNEGPWHVITNHFRCTAHGDGGCERYRRLSDRLTEANGQLDSRAAMQMLEEVKQGMTQWSAVYDMTSGEIQVALGGDYGTVYSFQLGLVER